MDLGPSDLTEGESRDAASAPSPIDPEPIAPVPIAPEPAALRDDDPVPPFRTDLQVGRGAGGGLFEVSDPARGRTFTLYEFELSVARMLDGRRRASEVVAASVRLGIPVDLAGLNKFIRQLWHYGFLAPPGSPPAGQGDTWTTREQWDEETRTLYQTGVRLLRQGRSSDAEGYFEAILDGHPGNPEATEMLALAKRGQGLPAREVGEEVALAPVGSIAAGEVPTGVPRPVRPRRRFVLAGAAAVILLAGAASAFLLSSRFSRPSSRATPAVAPQAPAPAPAPAQPPPAAPAQAPPPPAWRDHPVASRGPLVVGELTAPASGTVAWTVRDGAAVLERAPLGVLRAETTVPAPPSAEQRKKLDELARLARRDPVYEDFLAREQARVRGATRVVVRPAPLVAPGRGRLERLVPDRRRVATGTPLARIVDPDAWAVTVLDASPVAPGASCEIVGDEPSQRASCRFGEVRPGGALATIVSRGDAPWLMGARTPFVRITPVGAPPGPPTAGAGTPASATEEVTRP